MYICIHWSHFIETDVIKQSLYSDARSLLTAITKINTKINSVQFIIKRMTL